MRWCIFCVASALTTPRRSFLCGGAAALLTPLPSSAIIAGTKVSTSEAADSGSVALWIDLDGCEVCRHDVPAACSGTLVGRDLVLSAQHCIDVPETLNGKLSKVVFGNDIFDKTAPTVPVAKYLRPADVGLDVVKGPLGSDIVLIKLAKPAPKEWRVVDVGRTADKAVATLYGFGDTVDDADDYTSGVLHKVDLLPKTAIDPSKPTFFTSSTNAKAGSCNGDSGGALLTQPVPSPLTADPARRLIGVLSSNSMPCAGSTAAFANPAFFSEFLRRASAQLGSPLNIA